MPAESVMRVLVFGSRNLGAQHVHAMIDVLQRVAGTVGPETRLVLVHGDGPPGKTPGAVGADRLSEVAARLAWAGRARGLRRHTAKWREEGDSAGPRRNRRMADATKKPYRAVCFHTHGGFEKSPGSGSADMASVLRKAGVGYLLVLLEDESGAIIREEERR